MILLEFDLAGAEWVVVAYLAQDENMLGVVRSGKSPHIVTGALISGATEEFVALENEVVGIHTDPDTIESLRSKLQIPSGIFLPRVMSIRQAGKKSNHGLNYNMKYRRFALENEMPEADAEPIVEAYINKAYPGLKNYWKSIRDELHTNSRVLTNCFGRKVRLLKERGEELYNQAYSFKPQSTVVDIVNFTMKSCYHNQTRAFKNMFLGAQVHDSLQIQCHVPTSQDGWEDLCTMINVITKEYMRREINYGTPFRLNSDAKIGLNWGDTRKIKVFDDWERTKFAIQEVIDAAALSEASRQEAPEVEVEAALERQSQAPQESPLSSQFHPTLDPELLPEHQTL